MFATTAKRLPAARADATMWALDDDPGPVDPAWRESLPPRSESKGPSGRPVGRPACRPRVEKGEPMSGIQRREFLTGVVAVAAATTASSVGTGQAEARPSATGD